ncbi:DUF7146 domain-containing protein [Oceanibaculum indicum]|uniref:Uncharacterized protein n=1 Tax=Oceanibaculum indicum P24 TaxID=1207063 RepID=K2JJZ1_9PROT|nr:toprim domain-containing protein [Oceanibaculum indicum]EKE70879.1 hypothetical protein P24_15089 [Oceanibaculum indicum P24]
MPADSAYGPDRLTVRDIAGLLADRAEEVARALLPLGSRRGAEWVELERARGGLGDSLSVCISGPKRGRWWHHAAGQHGDLIDLYAYLHSADPGQAVTWAKGFLGLTDDRVALPPPRRSAYADDMALIEREKRNSDWARRIWRGGTIPADGTRTEAYLRERGFPGDIPKSLRHAPALTHPDGGEFPAMVAAIQRADGEIVAIHRTFLSRTGGKADVGTAKMILGPARGAAVRLSPRKPRLVLAEGIETALSLLTLWPGACVWACLSTSGLRGIVLPDWVEEVVICPDYDRPCETPGPMFGKRPGMIAVAALQESLANRARPVPSSIVLPHTEGLDFNDVIRAPDGPANGGGR